MDELQLLLSKCKLLHKKVTETYNTRGQFFSLPSADLFVLKNRLNDHLQELKELDNKIQCLKWLGEIRETELDEKFTKCEEYIEKISVCCLFGI